MIRILVTVAVLFVSPLAAETRVPASQATRPFRGFGDFAAFGADEASVVRISRGR